MNPDIDAREDVPFSFLFCGPPGTGKTTTARKMGQVYYDMGFLDSVSVEECSATDMIAEWVGQTGPKVRKLLSKARGKVLLIDEAYRLAGGTSTGHDFAAEAVNELIACMTSPEYERNMIIILAGYTEGMDKLLSTNPGLSSRFPERVDFKPLTSTNCFALLRNTLQEKKSYIESRSQLVLDISCVETPPSAFSKTILALFKRLGKTENWVVGEM